jgi:FlaA1/EpsC-like NDP-sugar epimerase
LSSIIKEYNPWIIYHAAAYKHVPIVENNKIQSIKNNIFGSYNVACCAIAHNIKNCLLISTDKAVFPKNMMGISKRFAELIFQGFSKNSNVIFSVVRFGNVLNSSGSVIPHFRDQILNGGPVTVTHKNVTRYFMTLSEAALLVIQASALSTGGDIFVLNMGKPIKILDIATKMILIYGVNSDIHINFIGLRKGEKMHEKLFIGKKIHKTDHPKIFKVIEPMISIAKICTLISRIRRHIDHDEYDKALKIINNLNIKEFKM